MLKALTIPFPPAKQWDVILKSLKHEKEEAEALINKKLLVELLNIIICQPHKFNEIPGGYSNDTYHYLVDDLVLRFPKLCNPLHRNQSIEVKNLLRARSFDLTPLTIIANYSKCQLLVTQFIPNYQTFTSNDFLNPLNLSDLADLVKKLHYSQSYFEKNPETALSFIDKSSKSFKNIMSIFNRSDYIIIEKLDALKALLAKFPVVKRPSHGDLHHFNLIKKDGVMQLIDWELSSVEDPANDIARFFCVTDLNNKQKQIFLNAYKSSFGIILSEINIESLKQRIQLFEPLNYFSIVAWAKYAIQFYSDEKRTLLQATITNYSEKTDETLKNMDLSYIETQIKYFQLQENKLSFTKPYFSFFKLTSENEPKILPSKQILATLP